MQEHLDLKSQLRDFSTGIIATIDNENTVHIIVQKIHRKQAKVSNILDSRLKGLMKRAY